MKGKNHVAEAVRQVTEGTDFFKADDLTRDLSPEAACRQAPGAPYSIATQVAHALVWQDVWLALVQSGTVIEVTDDMDFPQVECGGWPELRARFIAGGEIAEALAASEDLSRVVKDQTVGELLLRIAIHNAYHIGQIALLRQTTRLGMPVYETTHQG